MPLPAFAKANPTQHSATMHNPGDRAKDRRGADLISNVLPFGALWYDKPDATRFVCSLISVKHWEIIADRLSQAGWSRRLGYGRLKRARD